MAATGEAALTKPEPGSAAYLRRESEFATDLRHILREYANPDVIDRFIDICRSQCWLAEVQKRPTYKQIARLERANHTNLARRAKSLLAEMDRMNRSGIMHWSPLMDDDELDWCLVCEKLESMISKAEASADEGMRRRGERQLEWRDRVISQIASAFPKTALLKGSRERKDLIVAVERALEHVGNVPDNLNDVIDGALRRRPKPPVLFENLAIQREISTTS